MDYQVIEDYARALSRRLIIAVGEAVSEEYRSKYANEQIARAHALGNVASLLREGANPSTCLDTFLPQHDESDDEDGESFDVEPAESTNAIIIASANGDVECLAMLLSSPLANLAVVDSDGDTALTAASSCGQSSCISALLAAGADVNFPGNEGINSLMLAIACGSYESCLILAPLTDLSAKTVQNKSALDIAREKGGDIGAQIQDLLMAIQEAEALRNHCPAAEQAPPSCRPRSL